MSIATGKRTSTLVLACALTCTGTVVQRSAADGPRLPDVDANLLLHLAADVGTSTTAAFGPVTSWADQSGNGHVVTGSKANAPLYVPQAVNCSLPALRFTGTQQLSGNIGTNLGNATIFLAARYNVAPTGNSYIYAMGSPGSSGSQMTLSRSNNLSYHFNGSVQLTGDPIPHAQFHVFSQVYRAGVGGPFHTLYMNGVDMNVAEAPAPYSVSGDLVIGNWSSGAFRFRGDLLEVLVYDEALSDEDRISVEQYLSERLAVTIDPEPQLILHLRADVGTNAVADGEPVTEWTDQSGSGTVFTGNEPTSPTYIVPNCGQPRLRFTGGQRLNGTLVQGIAYATVFVVARYPQPSGNSYIYAMGQPGVNGSQISLSRSNGNVSYHFDGSSSLFGDPIPAPNFQVFSQVYRCQAEAGSFHTLYMNGVNLNVAPSSMHYFVQDTSMTIGNYTSGSFHFVGDLYEIRVYDRAMTDEQRQAVEAELMAMLPFCQPDLNDDGVVGVADLLILLAAWGECADCTPGNCPADLTGSCSVGVADLLILLANWG